MARLFQPPLADDYVLPVDDGEVRIRPIEGSWRVSRTQKRVLSTYGDASNERELDDLLRGAFGGGADKGVGSLRPRPADHARPTASRYARREIQSQSGLGMRPDHGDRGVAAFRRHRDARRTVDQAEDDLIG